MKTVTWLSPRFLALYALMAGIGGSVIVHSHQARPFVSLDEETKDALNAIVVPRFELHDATRLDAVTQLQLCALAQHQPMARPLRFAIWTNTKPPAGFHRKISKNGSINPSFEPVERVNSSLKDIPLGELMRYIGDLYGSQVATYGDTIYFVPGLGPGTFEPIITRKIRVNQIRPGISVREFLEDNGVEFYEGTDAVLSRSGRAVTVTNTQEQIDLCDAILDTFDDVPPTWWDYVCWYAGEAGRWLRSKL